MKNKRYFRFSMITSFLFFGLMSAFYDKLPLWKWLVVAVIFEVLTQVVGQLIFKKDDESDK